MMQVMMFAVGLYAGDFQGIDQDMQPLLACRQSRRYDAGRVVRGTPVFRGRLARRHRKKARHGPAGLDRGGQRLCRFGVRDLHRRRGRLVRLGDDVRVLPDAGTLSRDAGTAPLHRPKYGTVVGTAEYGDAYRRRTTGPIVPVSQLLVGDRVLIRAGDAIPADGVIESGDTSSTRRY